MTFATRSQTARRPILAAGLLLAMSLGAGAVLFHPATAATDSAGAASLDAAIARYRTQLAADIDRSVADVQKLRANVAGGDVAAAKQAWIEARVGWERSEVFTSGFAPELDLAIDAWPNGATGFHAIEAKLFGAGRTDVTDEVDALLHSLSDMAATARNTKLTSQGLLDGLTRLAYELGESKVDGGESRISGTSINDMRNNVDGIDMAYGTIFAAVIDSQDHDLGVTARRLIDELKSMLAERDLRQLDQERLRTVSEELVVTLQNAAPKLALARPALELQ